jgi:hypothetical protein
MRDLSATDPLVDDIATMIDEALADPSRAALVRAAIRTRLDRAADIAGSGPDGEAADDEDLWDNVPL